ncbi:MAG: ribosome maturation factor RimM [Chloroflexota bacterium]|nr:ribosome maturation factor RimM [Chloroflexota bacterium]
MLTDWPERVAPGAEVWIEGDEAPMRIDRMETGGRVPVVHLEAIRTREAAEPFVGRYLEGPALELEEGAYFWDDLIGLRVESPAGTPIGELVEIFRAGGNEVYRVLGPGGERLVPALRTAVERIDLDAGVMVVAPDDAEEVR